MGHRGVGRSKLGIAIFLAMALLCCGPASASTADSRGALDQLIYQETDTSVEGSNLTVTGCFSQEDHPYNAGGGIVLPFSYRPSLLFNAGPFENEWRFFVTGKGEGNPANLTIFQICSFIPTKYHSAAFSVPADGKTHSKTVACGKGERALSGGLLNYPGSAGQDISRAITESYPVDGPDKDRARGDAWRVTSRASKDFATKAKAGVICIKSSAVAVRYVHLDFVSHQKVFDGRYVDCKPGEQVTGGGPQLAKQKKGTRLTTSAPFDTPADDDARPSNRWATGLDGPNKGNVDATAWAACISVRE
jgi:hypothetical protein